MIGSARALSAAAHVHLLGAPAVSTFALLGWVGHAADRDPLRLTWSAPAGCPSVDDVRSAALRELDPRTASPDPLEADALVEEYAAGPSKRRFRVRLRTQRGSSVGERVIEADSCNGVAEATAVLLALALVPAANAPAANVKAVVPTPERPTPSSAGAAAPETEHALALGVSAAADGSRLPKTALGGSLTLAWTPGRLRLEIDVRQWLAQSRSVSETTTGARFSMTSIGARGCVAAVRSKSIAVAPCGGVDLDVVSAPGYGADENYSASAQWIALAGGVFGRAKLVPWLALRTRVEAIVPAARPSFVVENEGDVHRPAVLGVSGTLGLEVLFL